MATILIVAGSSAFAQSPSGPQQNAVPLGQPTRSFVLRKASPIASAEGRNVAVPGKSCIASVEETLQSGKELTLGHQNQCSLSQIVHADRVYLASSAVGPMPSKP